MGSNGAMIVPQDIKPKQTVRQDFRQCLIIAPRSSTCRVQLHWRLGQGADHGRMARVAEAWDRSKAPGATSRSTIFERKRTSSTSSAVLPKGRAIDAYPCVSLDRFLASSANADVADHEGICSPGSFAAACPGWLHGDADGAPCLHHVDETLFTV